MADPYARLDPAQGLTQQPSSGPPGLGGGLPGLGGGTTDLLSLISLLQQLKDQQPKQGRRPNEIQPSAPPTAEQGIGFGPPQYIQNGREMLGGIPYARNKWAVALSSLAAGLQNIQRVREVQLERQEAVRREMEQAERNAKLDQALTELSSRLNMQYGQAMDDASMGDPNVGPDYTDEEPFAGEEEYVAPGMVEPPIIIRDGEFVDDEEERP